MSSGQIFDRSDGIIEPFSETRKRIVPLQHFFGRMPWSFSIGFRWSVGRLKGIGPKSAGPLLSLQNYHPISFCQTIDQSHDGLHPFTVLPTFLILYTFYNTGNYFYPLAFYILVCYNFYIKSR